ncbi:MAG TPA: hypothetical protein VJI15_02285 [Candidatus Nanoarchaeia archaeon]|nr:hypothetical protein [Candidatus Nanoarchaeia archaeon]
MSISRQLNQVWNSLTPEDKAIIEKKTGVHPDACTTRAERYGLLAEFQAQTTNKQAFQLPPMGTPSGRRIAVSPLRDSSTIETVLGEEEPYQEGVRHYMVPANYPERGMQRRNLATIPGTFLKKAAEYTLILALTLGGAYAGFSVSRYTPLAEELRIMESNPIIRAYGIKQGFESYQKMKKWDVFSPDKEQGDGDKELINDVQEGVEGAVNGAINTVKGAVGWIPWFGGVTTSIINQAQQEKRQEISTYLQKSDEHSTQMGIYTAAGAGSGLALGITLSLLWRRKNR